MNCQTFQNIVGDLARDGLIEASVRTEGLTHAAGCADCEVRLTAERQLDAGIKGLAQADSKLEAPANIESALLHAFRNRAVETKEVSRPGEVVPFARRRYPWYTGAIAASVAMVAMAGFTWWIKSRPTVEQPPVTIADRHTGNEAIFPVSKPTESPENRSSQENGPIAQPKIKTSMTTEPKHKRRSVRPQRSTFIDPNELVAENRGQVEEIMTDFIPVSYSGALSQMESGRLVRVEMPRSVLTSFGLSVNAAQAHERVKADVLMDEFGTAQAVRFVK